jgi:RpiR family glv operon transcriptional regulator
MSMSLETIINQYHDQLNPNELEIVSYILANQETAQTMSIVELAEKCLTSKSSIHRLVKKLGFDGFTEFKYSMKSAPKVKQPKRDLLDMQIKDISATIKLMRQSDVKKIVEKMSQADRLFGFGTGWGQQNTLKDLNRNFMRLGKCLFEIPAKTEFDMLMPTFTEKDFVIIISLSGNTQDLKQNIQMLNMKNVPILSITGFHHNFLAQHCPYNLYYQSSVISEEEGDEIVSLVTLNVVCDALYREYISHTEQE